jgi:hypothetical protein
LEITQTNINQDFRSLELDLSSFRLAPGKSSFSRNGPDFGIRYPLWIGPQIFSGDDPSYIGLSNDFVETKAIPVFDVDGNIISEWTCYDKEAEIEGDIEVRVFARDNREGFEYSDNPIFYVENIGSVPLREFEVRYYFTADELLRPEVEEYPTNKATMNIVHYGNNEYYASLYYTRVLNPGEKTEGGVGAQLELHYVNWNTIWDSYDDISYQGLNSTFQESSNIIVLDKSGNIIWGSLNEETSSSTISSSNTSSISSSSSVESSSSTEAEDWVSGTEYIGGDKVAIGDQVCEVASATNAPWAHISPNHPTMWSVWNCVFNSADSSQSWVSGRNYVLDEVVFHNGKTWQSIVGNTQAWNIYEPDAIGMYSVWKCVSNCN